MVCPERGQVEARKNTGRDEITDGVPLNTKRPREESQAPAGDMKVWSEAFKARAHGQKRP